MRGVLRLRVRKLVVESDSRLSLIPFLRGNLRRLCAFFASKIFSHHEARHSKSSRESAPQENTSLDQNSRLVVLTNVPKKNTWTKRMRTVTQAPRHPKPRKCTAVEGSLPRTLRRFAIKNPDERCAETLQHR
ncbi:unnamed protein product [Ixodes persulcatus]